MAYTTIDDPTAFFQCTLYTGNNGTQTITHGGNSDLQADMIWGKARNDTAAHFLIDSVRGVSKRFKVNNGDAEATVSTGITAIGSDSFALGNDGDFNDSNVNYTSWNWKKQAGVFDIQIYTGNGSNRTISHNLGTVPKMMIIKKRNTSAPWSVGHASLGANQVLELDAQDAVATDNSYWNNTRPTSSVFSLGTDGNQNTNGHTYVIYLFGNKQGMSKMGSYKGNGNADGTFISTGFKPAWIMIKATDQDGEGWFMFDNKRDVDNAVDKHLIGNANGAEASGSHAMDFVSNGIKIRNGGDGTNTSAKNYVYMAFAKNPFVTSTGVPATAR